LTFAAAASGELGLWMKQRRVCFRALTAPGRNRVGGKKAYARIALNFIKDF
jgi:hypothetical protein